MRLVCLFVCAPIFVLVYMHAHRRRERARLPGRVRIHRVGPADGDGWPADQPSVDPRDLSKGSCCAVTSQAAVVETDRPIGIRPRTTQPHRLSYPADGWPSNLMKKNCPPLSSLIGIVRHRSFNWGIYSFECTKLGESFFEFDGLLEYCGIFVFELF